MRYIIDYLKEIKNTKDPKELIKYIDPRKLTKFINDKKKEEWQEYLKDLEEDGYILRHPEDQKMYKHIFGHNATLVTKERELNGTICEPPVYSQEDPYIIYGNILNHGGDTTKIKIISKEYPFKPIELELSGKIQLEKNDTINANIEISRIIKEFETPNINNEIEEMLSKGKSNPEYTINVATAILKDSESKQVIDDYCSTQEQIGTNPWVQFQ